MRGKQWEGIESRGKREERKSWIGEESEEEGK